MHIDKEANQTFPEPQRLQPIVDGEQDLPFDQVVYSSERDAMTVAKAAADSWTGFDFKWRPEAKVAFSKPCWIPRLTSQYGVRAYVGVDQEGEPGVIVAEQSPMFVGGNTDWYATVATLDGSILSSHSRDMVTSLRLPWHREQTK